MPVRLLTCPIADGVATVVVGAASPGHDGQTGGNGRLPPFAARSRLATPDARPEQTASTLQEDHVNQSLPTPAVVGARAADILAAIKGCDEYDRLEGSTRKYPACWATFTGYPLISQWDLQADAAPLVEEGLRVLCLKTAVFELTDGDEYAAELEISAPVDEMVHAILAQYTLCQTMTATLGIRFVHMTDQERFGYRAGGYTDRCYTAAGWGEPDRRYWLDRDEMAVRLGILGKRYASVGINPQGTRHDIDFEAEKAWLILAI
jgi:hypothetical protein